MFVFGALGISLGLRHREIPRARLYLTVYPSYRPNMDAVWTTLTVRPNMDHNIFTYQKGWLIIVTF